VAPTDFDKRASLELARVTRTRRRGWSDALSQLVSGILGDSVVKRDPRADAIVTASEGPYNSGARQRRRARGVTK
jgi:hypothetical protein